MEATGGIQAGAWIAANAVVGGPLALAVVVVLRESIRAAVALALGFRVFEIQCGVGRPLFRRALGPIDFALAPLPLGGITIARSGVARGHRLARSAIALGPALGQALWLIAWIHRGPDPLAALAEGPAATTVIALANAFLLGLHLTLPIATRAGLRSDLRRLVDAALSPPNESRAARASHYARLARLRLERADVAAARAALDQGLVQLGREPLLVACASRFEATDLASVIDQGECADALQRLVEEAETAASTPPSSFGARLLRSAVLGAPLLLLASLAIAAQAPRAARLIESRWQLGSEPVVSQGEAEACGAYVEGWTASARRRDRWFPPDASTRSDRHVALARLEQCRGNLEVATQHQGEALLAANAARAELAPRLFSEPDRWLENELRLTELFRNAAAVETERQAFRRALVAITNAERRLETVRRQIGQWPEAETRSRAEQTVAAEQAELGAMRAQVMASLTGR